MSSRGSVVARSSTQTQATSASRKRRRNQQHPQATSTPQAASSSSSSSNLIGGSHSADTLRDSGISTSTSTSTSQARKKVKKGAESSSASARKSKDQEKRRKRFRSSCPKNILDRVGRVWSQRFFCVHRDRTSPTSENFSVLGSTGNVYVVTIDSEPGCTCPDAQKGNFCKHILFVMLKVLQVSQGSNLWYQAALLQSELEEIFVGARPAPQDEQTRRAQAVYRKAVGKFETTEAEDTSTKKRVPEEGDACPVCYEDYEAGKVQGLVFCESCGNGLHAGCFRSWSRQQNTCVMCRAPWVYSSTSAASGRGAGASVREGYVNLGQSLGISRVRDTSTYHQPWLHREDLGMNHRGNSGRGYHQWGTGRSLY
ncbi:BQ2448_4668 [Microbotryum intermedium]|uniref:BQ2448_4668 protein n=1 Tax=Microbotryum intermedium TaxID=269621 RepID=A0A238FJB1_9BASI|nr:BQ2448_4668 [Microbotryum intermedium]